ncbi:hypothetical protein CDD82_7790 [Ophiocordyceps australis]|uniref:Mediator of RNA polymerase II transcription subunit 17 n=1 Tax=Ophiocordyceps australis TaxID=1399860 RepID=A0A2C5YNS6_9HYPO|nr:hypothetical protein CDD82_7790 [Ophiocordyceps australis]
MAAHDSASLSLRPFPVADKDPKNLAEFIARVNAQPGGFRALSESSLRQEITSRDQEGTAAVDDDDDDDDDDNDDDDDGQDEMAHAHGAAAADDAPSDAAQARLEVLRNVDIASNCALLTLDFLSLLLSKQTPTQASLTLSQQLRDMVGIGTMGADKLDDALPDPTAATAKEQAALGLTLMEITRTRDVAIQASRHLAREVEAESRYWSSVLAIKKAGWSLCRVPHQRHTLAVRFGFSEAAPDFRSNGLAPLRRADTGTVHLDLGRLGGVSEAVLVTYQQNGKTVGRSVPCPSASAPPSPALEQRVLEARNTIFAQELWHELAREARTLAAYNVRLNHSRLTCDLSPSSRILIQLLPLDACPTAPDPELPQNAVAQAVAASLHLLLSYAHRYNELMRTRPIPPHMSRARAQSATYSLLRPILARFGALLAMRSSTRYVGGLVASLRVAGFSASFVLRTTPLSPDESTQSISPAQSLVRSLLQPHEFVLDVNVMPGVSFTIRARTFLFPVTTTHYHVLLPPDSPLRDSTSPFPDGYLSLRALYEYIDLAATRSLLSHAVAKMETVDASLDHWVVGQGALMLRDKQFSIREIRFCVGERNLPWLSQLAKDDEPAKLRAARNLAMENNLDLPPFIRILLITKHDDETRSRCWNWNRNSPNCESRSFDQVLCETVDTIMQNMRQKTKGAMV